MADTISGKPLLDLYSVAGELAIQWGLFEASMVSTISMVYQDLDGKTVEKQLPVSFKKRMEFLKRCFNQIPKLAPYSAEARAIRSKAKELVFIRNFIIHGYLSDHDPQTLIYTFGRLDTEDDQTHIENTLQTRLTDLMGASSEIYVLFDKSHALNERLMEAITGEDKTDNLGGTV